MKVWGIWFAIRVNSVAKWGNWHGPIGVHVIKFVPQEIKDVLPHRPFFFRTRKQAREHAKKADVKSNKTWVWIKHQVRPIELTWQECKRGERWMKLD